jgi:hypothetical protein
MVIGLVGNTASDTVTKLFAGATFHVILYVVGEFVVLLYGNGVVCALALKHTLVVLDANVMVGNTFTVLAVDEVAYEAAHPPIFV